MKFKFDDEVVNVMQIRQIENLPEGPLSQEKWRRVLRTTCSHLAFAQLRAEMPENDAWGSRRNAENWKSRNFDPRSE